MSVTRRVDWFGAAVWLACAAGGSAVAAEEPEPAESSALQEVIVTAQKHEQSANDVGITMSVISADRLRELGVTSADALARSTPGLTVNATAATGIPAYSLRGVGFQDFSTGGSSTVGLYFDEVNIPYAVMSRGVLFDVERVEVLKGPQGDLYGRNTTAGQINFISRRPTNEFEGGVNLSYGSYQTVDGEAFVSGPISDRVRGRLAARTLQSGKGWQKSLTRDERLGEQDIAAVRGLLDFDLAERITLGLNVHYVKDKSDNQAPATFNGQEIGLPTVAFAPHNPLQDYTNDLVNLTATPPWFAGHDAAQADWTNSYTSAITGTTWNVRPGRDNELKGVSARLGWKFGGVEVVSLTAYDEFERVEAFEGDGGPFVDTSNINTTDVNVFSQELRFSGGTDRLIWITGLYYSKDKLDEAYHFLMPDSVYGNASVPWNVAPFNLAPILELDTKYRQHSDSNAAFGHVEWSFAERWKLTAGVRYTEEKRDWAGCTFSAADNSLGNFLNTLFGATLQAGDCGTIDDDPNSPTNIFNVLGTPAVNDAFHVFTDDIETRKWMWKIGLDRHLTDNALLYGIISRGFKSGGFNGAASNVTQQLAPYGPEELTAYELGTKLTLLDRTLQLNASAFYYDYRDKQEADAAVTFVGNISGLTNVPKSRIQGAEIEAHWAPVRGLNIDAAAAWLDTKVLEWQATDPFLSVWPNVVTFNASGTELPQAPRWSYNAAVSYRWPVSNDLYMQVGADASYVDTTSGGANAFAFATKAYTLGNARIALGDADGKWVAQLWGRNITDEFYYPSAFVGNGPYVRMVGMPRTVGVSLDYRW